MKRVFALSGTALLLTFASTSPAFAHPGHSVPGNGITAGLLHPLLGWDHLLAMFTIGLLSAQIGGRARWQLPGTFVLCMIGGGIAGMFGWAMPAVEFGIAASVLLLGLAVARSGQFPIAVPLGFAGLFGFIHGQAHGLEMPQVASPLFYAIGFVVATVVLHVGGVFVGYKAQQTINGARRLRLSGAAVALAGWWLLFAA